MSFIFGQIQTLNSGALFKEENEASGQLCIKHGKILTVRLYCNLEHNYHKTYTNESFAFEFKFLPSLKEKLNVENSNIINFDMHLIFVGK